MNFVCKAPRALLVNMCDFKNPHNFKHISSNTFYEIPWKLKLDKIHAICKVCKEITSLTCVFHSELDIWIPQPFHAEVPVDWWDSEADKSLLIGVFKHGKKHISIITQVPILGINWLHIRHKHASTPQWFQADIQTTFVLWRHTTHISWPSNTCTHVAVTISSSFCP